MAKGTGRYWAITGLGWGRGETAEEATANYVAAQLRNYRAADTVFETRPKFKAALETGECAARVWQAPEGTEGFYADPTIHWQGANDEDLGTASAETMVVDPHPTQVG